MAKTRKRSKPASESDEDLEMEQEEELEIEESEPLEALTTDVEGFPISEDDREGLINLLTQVFFSEILRRSYCVDFPAKQ